VGLHLKPEASEKQSAAKPAPVLFNGMTAETPF
jgi:hypothetical protein